MTPLLSPWLSIVWLLVIMLLMLTFTLLCYCVFTIGRRYTVFYPFRLLLLWILAEVAWYLAVDVWAFLRVAELRRAQILTIFLVSQVLLVCQVTVFAATWLRALTRLAQPSAPPATEVADGG